MLFGYFVMVLMFFILRFFYHILPKKRSQDKITVAVKNDFIKFYGYVKQIFLSYPKAVKIIISIIAALIALEFLPLKTEIGNVIEDILSTIMCAFLVIIFAPQENSTRNGFPIEIFGFIYSIVFLFYCSGAFVFDLFYANDFFKEDMWIYGYSITLISYVVCIAALRGFMERELSKEEIVFLGMIMMVTLEFITYYGIGFFSGMKWYDSSAYDANIFGNVTSVINQGIYVASQSQILERTPMEVWGNIILNGTDALSITAVLGYMAQKFMTNTK